MSHKQFVLDEKTTVTIYKRRASRSLRLTVAPGGHVRVSIPVWAPYAAGLSFAQSRQAWIQAQHLAVAPLRDEQIIGKAHHLSFQAVAGTTKVTSRIKDTTIIVSYSSELEASDPMVQAVAQKACIRALRQQAEQLLPRRLASLAAQHGFRYGSVSVKQLKSRWGSCDQQRNIVLNLYLMQLPWALIDYVLLHELTHTTVLKHGPEFWQALTDVLPESPARRKAIRSYQPQLNTA